jgi:exonuclease VII large subunit
MEMENHMQQMTERLLARQEQAAARQEEAAAQAASSLKQFEEEMKAAQAEMEARTEASQERMDAAMHSMRFGIERTVQQHMEALLEGLRSCGIGGNYLQGSVGGLSREVDDQSRTNGGRGGYLRGKSGQNECHGRGSCSRRNEGRTGAAGTP